MRVWVITAPRLARECMEGKRTLESALRSRGIPVCIWEDISTERAPLDVVNKHTVGLSLGAAWVFRQALIRRFRGRLLNCHGSCLPEDRGGGGFSYRILRGDRRGQCVIHQIDAGIDSGPIVASRTFQFSAACRIPRDYLEQQSREDLGFLTRFLERVRRGEEFELRQQDATCATYWPRLNTDVHGAIDWHWQVADLERFICAFDDPYQGAYTFLNGRRVHIKQVEVFGQDRVFHPFQAGLIYRVSTAGAWVSCVSGNLLVRRILDEEGNNLLDSSSALVGERLWTPIEHLERAMTTRVRYTSVGRECQLRTPALKGG